MLDNTEHTVRGIKSVEKMLQILEFFLDNEELTLKEIAEKCQASTANVSPYLKSLVALELLDKIGHGCYQLGRECLDLGMIALEKYDPFLNIEQVINHIYEQHKVGVIVTAWGPMGPTVIRIKEGIAGLYPELRIGTLSSLVNSSNGRLFSANQPYHLVREALKLESFRYHGRELTEFEIDDYMNEIQFWDKKNQLNHQQASGLSSMSVPIYEVGGHVKYVLSVFHKTHILNMKQILLKDELAKISEELSRKFGY